MTNQANDFIAQTEEEFQNLLPVTGTVNTFFGDFELDHSFPAVGEAEKIYDLMDHQRAAGGKATMGSKTPGLRTNEDGSYDMLLGPDAAPEGWEANHVQTLPGRGWFPYMRAYGAQETFFNDEYKFPTVNKVKDFSEVLG